MYEKEYVDLHYINIDTGESTRISFDGSRYGLMTSPTTLVYTGERKGLWQLEVSFDDKQLVQATGKKRPLQKVSGKVFNTA